MRTPFIVSALALASCGWNAAGSTGCRPEGDAQILPEMLGETSGVAWSRERRNVLLTHNDGGDGPVLYALSPDGTLLGTIRLEGAANQDWEDMATGSCPFGSCIYIADVGDNQEVRERVFLYRTEDRGSYDGSAQGFQAFPMVFPDGPRDAEALLVLPGEEVFLVTKGRNGPAALYRYPPPLRSGEPVTLEQVQLLSRERLPLPQQITGADATPDGKLVAVRSYRDLRFYSVDDGRLLPLEGGRVRLHTLNELQGEAVGLGPGGRVALTSEGALGQPPLLSLLRCHLEGPGGWRPKGLHPNLPTP